MGFFLAAMRWFIGKHWPYLLAALAIMALCVKVWIWRGNYDEAKGLKDAAKKTEALGVIRNRPADAGTVVKRLRNGTF